MRDVEVRLQAGLNGCVGKLLDRLGNDQRPSEHSYFDLKYGYRTTRSGF